MGNPMENKVAMARATGAAMPIGCAEFLAINGAIKMALDVAEIMAATGNVQGAVVMKLAVSAMLSDLVHAGQMAAKACSCCPAKAVSRWVFTDQGPRPKETGARRRVDASQN
jgi:hypothetical protein